LSEGAFTRLANRIAYAIVARQHTGAAAIFSQAMQRWLEHFSIGHDLMPREMIKAYATLKKSAANANHAGGWLDDKRYRLLYPLQSNILEAEIQTAARVAKL
jgi:fumarate hydratase class II